VSNPGYFFTATAIMLILGRGLGGRLLDLYSKERVIQYCLIIMFISMIILACSKTLPMFLLVGLIWGAGVAFLTPAILAYALERVGSTLGPAIGTFAALSDLGTGLGPVIMGIVIGLTDYSVMFLCSALVGIINLLFFLFFVRRRGPAHDAFSG
jgi:MFS family permease